MKIFLENDNGAKECCKVGFSFTMLFFGFFVPLFRGDVKWFVVYIIVWCFSFGTGCLLLCFFYNGIYIKKLLKQGYKPSDDFSKNILQHKGWIVN